MKIKIHPYKTWHYPFRDSIAMMLGTDELENLHRMGGYPRGVVKPGSDNHTVWHNKFYDSIASSGFMDIYNDFISEIIRPLFDNEALVVQNRPTFRIHWQGNLSVGAFHRYSDYNHNEAEVNFWIPVTHAFDTNTIWIESARGKKDYSAINVHHGQALEFPGCELMHGNEINNTGQTRVSFDFRVIPHSKYREPAEPKAGVGHGLHKFKLGEYYRLIGNPS